MIDKPAGLVVHPGSGNWSGTMLNALLRHAPALAGVPRAGIVHRLDKDTSGLLVVAKTFQPRSTWCASCRRAPYPGSTSRWCTAPWHATAWSRRRSAATR